MVAAEHDRSDLALADHLVKLHRDLILPVGVLIEDAALGADDQLVLLASRTHSQLSRS